MRSQYRAMHYSASRGNEADQIYGRVRADCEKSVWVWEVGDGVENVLDSSDITGNVSKTF